MAITKPVSAALKTWRSVFGEDTKIEHWVKDRYLSSVDTQSKREAGPGWVQYSGKRSLIISESDDFPEPRRGILLKGGCDLPSVFTMAPLFREGLKGTIAISRHSGGTGGNRSDQILQTLDIKPSPELEETMRILEMGEDYFEPTFFDRTMTVRDFPDAGTFPKSLVILSIASDMTRQMYRHREGGFLADPGGWWLNQDLDRVLGDLDTVDWFREKFVRVGRMSLDDFRANTTRLVTEIRDRMGAEVVIYNSLVLDPASPVHNYQLIKTAHSVRRRQFVIALAEMSRQLGFSIVDIDRILKESGVSEQVDFAHFPVERMAPIGIELHRIITESGLLNS